MPHIGAVFSVSLQKYSKMFEPASLGRASVHNLRRLTQRLRQAKLRYPASLEDVDFTTPRGLNREVVLSLGTGG
jgi:hypothetical protein